MPDRVAENTHSCPAFSHDFVSGPFPTVPSTLGINLHFTVEKVEAQRDHPTINDTAQDQTVTLAPKPAFYSFHYLTPLQRMESQGELCLGDEGHSSPDRRTGSGCAVIMEAKEG